MEGRPKLRVAIYCRSCHEKTDELVEFQTSSPIYRIACNPGWKLEKVYGDFGVDGALDSPQPSLHQLGKDCRSRKVDIVIFRSMSRLNRDTLKAIEITRKLQELGVRVIFDKEGIDTKDPQSERALTIIKTLAEGFAKE